MLSALAGSGQGRRLEKVERTGASIAMGQGKVDTA
jgi:hypothetical protein